MTTQNNMKDGEHIGNEMLVMNWYVYSAYLHILKATAKQKRTKRQIFLSTFLSEVAFIYFHAEYFYLYPSFQVLILFCFTVTT